MVSVIIGVGSNCGNRKELVETAISWLKGILMQVECSDIYETPCALKVGKPYLNAVVKGFYNGDGMQLQDVLKDKEKVMGRTAACRDKGDVPIDMDIVVCNEEIWKEWDFRQKFFKIGYDQIM